MTQNRPTHPPIFDGHNDTVLSLEKTGRSFFERTQQGHIDLPRARAGGLGGGFFAVYIHDPINADRADAAGSLEATMRLYRDESTWPEPMSLEYAQSAALRLLGRLLRIPQASQGEVAVVHTAAELQQCLDAGVFAMLLHFEGAEPLDLEGHALEVFYAAGLRSVGLTHSRRNRFACGVPLKFPSSPDTGAGLTDAGKELVRQLNRRRVMIDLSHITERGFWDVAALSAAPLVATHSNAHAICAASRNLTDRQLRAIRDSGGVVGVNFAVTFLREDGRFLPDETTVEDIVRHVDHLVDVMGIDHVAFGSDFDGAGLPTELDGLRGLPPLVEALRSRYDDDAVAKITHGNWLRVFAATWR